MKNTLILIITDYQIIVSIVFIIAAWKWGDWKNWKLYYPSMLFFALGDLTYGLLSYNFPLWEFESPLLGTTLSDLLISFVCFPATVLIYLPHFPKGFKKQVPYVLLWIILYTAIERASHLLGFFSYSNGWSIWLSVLFNLVMFPLLQLHHKKPLWAVSITVILAITGVICFGIPLSSMK